MDLNKTVVLRVPQGLHEQGNLPEQPAGKNASPTATPVLCERQANGSPVPRIKNMQVLRIRQRAGQKIAQVERTLANKWQTGTLGFALAAAFGDIRQMLADIASGSGSSSGASDLSTMQENTLAGLETFQQKIEINRMMLATEPLTGQTLTWHARRLQLDILAREVGELNALLLAAKQPVAAEAPTFSRRRGNLPSLTDKAKKLQIASPGQQLIRLSSKKKHPNTHYKENAPPGSCAPAWRRSGTYVLHQDPVTGTFHNSPVLPPLTTARPAPGLANTMPLIRELFEALEQMEMQRRECQELTPEASDVLRDGLRKTARLLDRAQSSERPEEYLARLLAALNLWETIEAVAGHPRDAATAPGLLCARDSVCEKFAALLDELDDAFFDRDSPGPMLAGDKAPGEQMPDALSDQLMLLIQETLLGPEEENSPQLRLDEDKTPGDPESDALSDRLISYIREALLETGDKQDSPRLTPASDQTPEDPVPEAWSDPLARSRREALPDPGAEQNSPRLTPTGNESPVDPAAAASPDRLTLLIRESLREVVEEQKSLLWEKYFRDGRDTPPSECSTQ